MNPRTLSPIVPAAPEQSNEARIKELEAITAYYSAIGGSWGGIMRLAKDGEKALHDKSKHSKILPQIRAYCDRIESAIAAARKGA